MDSKSTLGKKKHPVKLLDYFTICIILHKSLRKQTNWIRKWRWIKTVICLVFWNILKYFEIFWRENGGNKLRLQKESPNRAFDSFPPFSANALCVNFFDQRKLDIQYSATKASTERLTVFPPFFSKKMCQILVHMNIQTYIKDFMTCLTVRSWIVSLREFLLKIQQRTDLLQSVWQDLNAPLSNNRHHTRKS